MSEEEIVHMLSSAGTVTKFRLMTNPETGKPKGFGFADFSDPDSAASAVRNLNDREIQGRKIRVDWPHNNEKDSVPQDYSQMASTANAGNVTAGGQSLAGAAAPAPLPPLPQGVDLPPNLKCADAISNTLKTLPPPQLLDILSQMKTLAMSDPETAKRLMQEAPQLAYAIFQALVLMNLVDPSVLATVVEQNVQGAGGSQIPMQGTTTAAGATAAAAAAAQQQQQSQQSQPSSLPQHPPPPQQQLPTQYPYQLPGRPGIPPTAAPQQQPQQPPPPPQPSYAQLPSHPSFPQQHQQPQQFPSSLPHPPPQQQQPQQPQSGPTAPTMSPEQRQMLEQVMQLDQRTIDSLPPNERMQIMQLRQQYQQIGVR